MSEMEDLSCRAILLERENEELRRQRRRPVGRSIVAGIVLVLAVLMAPVAVVGTWVRLQLLDADRFVATFAPLAEDPDVQDFVADQVSAAIQEQADFSAIVAEVFDGIRALELPPRASAALALLEDPVASGLTSLVDSVIHDVVASDQFADIWAQSLRFTHDRAVAILEGGPETVVRLADDGVVSIDLGKVVDRVKVALTERGVGFAELIPETDRSVPIAQADGLVSLRTVYQIAVFVGFWLPWLTLALVVAGILIARDRPRALLRIGVGFAVAFLLLSAAAGIGRAFFIGAVSPSVMTVGAAQSLFDEVTSLLSSTIVALALVGVLVAVWAWLAGESRRAGAIRGILESGFTAIRSMWERRGLSTGRLGVAVDRFHGPILIAAFAFAALILITSRPVTFGAVVGVAGGLMVLAVVIELLRRPRAAEQPNSTDIAALHD